MSRYKGRTSAKETDRLFPFVVDVMVLPQLWCVSVRGSGRKRVIGTYHCTMPYPAACCGVCVTRAVGHKIRLPLSLFSVVRRFESADHPYYDA
jgi:hypothetical protein